jgi:hypothetical protein
MTGEAIPVRINRRDTIDRPTEWLCAQCQRWGELVRLVAVRLHYDEPVHIQLCADCD